jgi:hypothetical protein
MRTSKRAGSPHPKFQSRKWIALSIVVAALSASLLCAADSVEYPDGFRRWVHVGTGVILPGGALPESEQGMHHVFANPKAVDGYAKGDFADGSIIVYELREAQQKNGIIFEGDRRRVDVMIKDSNLYKNTGGWRRGLMFCVPRQRQNSRIRFH